MITNDLLRTAVRLEYTLLRVPLAVLDRQVVSRLAESSPMRRTFEHGLESLDVAVARLLADAPAPAPGTTATATGRAEKTQPAQKAQTTRRPAPGSAPHADAEPDDVIPHSDQEPDVDVPVTQLSGEQQDEVTDLTEELLDMEQDKVYSGELADDDELRRVQAEIKAKQIVEDEGANRRTD